MTERRPAGSPGIGAWIAVGIGIAIGAAIGVTASRGGGQA
jgi:hypothetical protein